MATLKKQTHKLPELVCPAGDWASLRAAVQNGADSVYFGIKGMSMRAAADNFDILELSKIMEYLQAHNCKGYLALNTVIKENELDTLKTILTAARRTGVHAVIIWDMAAVALAKKIGVPFHISTQASVSNSAAIQHYALLGASRIILARECGLTDLAAINGSLKSSSRACRIEIFIHGAMCLSISGRCFLSAYSSGKSANRGQCRQPCRKEYLIKDTQDSTEYIIGKDYVLSPKDLCTMPFIDTLIESGVDAFKIEGRMRPAEYVKTAVSCYRKALNAYAEGTLTQTIKEQLTQELSTVYHRGFSNGFYFGQPSAEKSDMLRHTYEKIYLGEVKKYYKKIGVAEITVRSRALKQGDTLLFIGKHTPALSAIVCELQQNRTSVASAQKGQAVGVKLPFAVKPQDKVFLWRPKNHTP